MNFYRETALINARAVESDNDADGLKKLTAQNIISTVESLDSCDASEDEYQTPYLESLGL